MASKYNSNIQWQKDSNYIIRCIECSFGPSAAGNPMITFDYEVASPEFMEVAGEQFEIAGVKIRTWQVCQTLVDGVVDADKTKKNLEALGKLFDAFEIDKYLLNPENPPIEQFKSKSVCALLYNKEEEQRKSPTAAQLAAGQRQGDVLINPKTKLPLKRNSPAIGEIFCLAPTDASKPY